MFDPWVFVDEDDPTIPQSGESVKLLFWLDLIDGEYEEVVLLEAPEWAFLASEIAEWRSLPPVRGLYLAEFRLDYATDEEGETDRIIFTLLDRVFYRTPSPRQIDAQPLSHFKGGTQA